MSAEKCLFIPAILLLIKKFHVVVLVRTSLDLCCCLACSFKGLKEASKVDLFDFKIGSNIEFGRVIFDEVVTNEIAALVRALKTYLFLETW